ncbi:MAG: hypothetical protein GY754_25570 [bacterium]|nr:hypothetical protein [bacterium]
MNRINQIDKNLRQSIAEYYMALNEMNDPQKSVAMLAEHVAIMVEMINEFKSTYSK